MIPQTSYLETAKTLSLGSSTYAPHEGCTNSPKMWVLHSKDGYLAYCNKCGEKGFTGKGIRKLSELDLTPDEGSTDSYEHFLELPDDTTFDVDDFPLEARVWLYKSDIRNSLISKWGIGYSPRWRRVILPVYDASKKLLLWQGRGLYEGQTKYHTVRGINKSKIMMCSWVPPTKFGVWGPKSYDYVVVVEDFLSTVRVGEVAPTVSLLGTTLSDYQLLYLAKFKHVIWWLDDDKGGLMGGDKGLKKTAMLTKASRIRTDKDPKELPTSDIQNYIKEQLC